MGSSVPGLDAVRSDRPISERRWALIRVALGILQMFGASMGAVLLFQTGVTRLSLLVVVITGLCTTLSVFLFGRRNSKS